MFKILITDLDHTLLRQDGTVSSETLKIINECRADGLKFAIATARYWIGAEKYIDLLKPDYEMTTDGTLIHSGSECIYSCEFTEEDTNLIIHGLLESDPDTEITVASGKTVYWNSKDIKSSEKLHKAEYNDYSKYLNVRANKIAVRLYDEKIAHDIAERACCKLQGYRGENWYSFMPGGSGKTVAIDELTKISGIGLEDIVAFGDDVNDLDMLKLCGKGVAVANAVPEVLAQADEVTLKNDEDGVADWLVLNYLSDLWR